MTDHTTHQTSNEIPYGYCHCGCGQKTWIPTKSQAALGYVKGQPVRFIHGHGRRKQGSLADAFWLHVTSGNPNDCWEWQGGKNPKGYGQLYYRRAQHKAHRLSWELHNGPIPGGMDVCHKCDNPPCCNPNHLFLGTRAENTLDMYAKGRNRQINGEKCHKAKLTESDIPEIRRLHSEGMSQTALAKQYGVSQHSISSIVRGKSWKHVA